MEILVGDKQHACTRGRLPCLGDVATVNVTRGCAGQCAYCYARCYTGTPAPGKLLIYRNLPALLRHELDSARRRRALPDFVLFCSAGDPFLGGPEVLELSRACLELLLRREIGVSLTTRGVIPEAILALLARHRPRVRISVALASTADDYTQRWEPGTALPQARLRLLQRLLELELAPQVHIEPLIPFVNDGQESLQRLLSALDGLGVRRAMVSLLQLRPGVAAQLAREAPHGVQRLILGCFPSGRHGGRRSEYDHLVHSHALSILRRISSAAADHGIVLTVCHCHNPGLAGGRCELAPAPATPGATAQADLFSPA
ncbi:MAG: radical SAM protein [Proteobacteria bacterium]|nr:radical SAM protein [Pseudomonadota bacterium]